jgi:phosphoribosylaminoimidazole-succinocarboxamide synthase
MSDLVWQTELFDLDPPKRGKVRDVYELDDLLLIVACDRISAYDHVLEPGIPGKGKVLNQLTNFWFERTRSVVPNHLRATNVDDFPAALQEHAAQLDGRSVVVRKAEVIPFECVARGYLAGSAYKEYRQRGTACGHILPTGLERGSKLPEPIFTPATKAEDGHDENIDFDTLADAIGEEMACRLRSLTIELYRLGEKRVAEHGLILADTKFEFGLIDGELALIDEVLTPDSSRYWDAKQWKPGAEPTSFDKQYVRDWLDAQGWDHETDPPELPDEVVAGTAKRYLEAFRRITGSEPAL